MSCHGNHAISHDEMDLLLGEINFLPLSGLILPFGINKKYSYGFNVGLIAPWGTSLSNGFVLFLSFH